MIWIILGVTAVAIWVVVAPFIWWLMGMVERIVRRRRQGREY